MCVLLWIGTTSPLTPVATATTADPLVGFYRVEAVAIDAPIRARFGTPHVTYVGSHEGCGCGFASGGLAFEGFETVADVLPLLGAMADDERDDFLAEQRSRERLHGLVNTALADGAVHVYTCWAGDEDAPATRVEQMRDATWITTRVDPMEERVLYVLGE